jgi:uncharacterized membrane protein
VTDLNAWLAFLHILGASVWVGAWTAICAFGANAVRHPSADAFHRLYAVMRLLGPAVIGPSTLLVLGAGIALVVRSERAAMSDLWIAAGLALYVVITLLGMIGLSRASRTADAALERGDVDAATRATRGWLRIAVLITALLVLATADMVIRP